MIFMPDKPILQIIKETFARGETVIASQVVIGTEHTRARAAVTLHHLYSKKLIGKCPDPVFIKGRRGAPAVEWYCEDIAKLFEYEAGSNLQNRGPKGKFKNKTTNRIHRCL